MSGFVNRNTGTLSNTIENIRGPIRKLFRAGQEYEDLVSSQSLGIGPIEAQLTNSNGGQDDLLILGRSYDYNPSKANHLTYTSKKYLEQRQYLRDLATHREISKFIEIIADESIIYDENNFFCKPNITNLSGIDDNYREEIKTKLNDNFNFLYTKVFNFKNTTTAWRSFKKYLIDGTIAYELIYDKTGSKIIGSRELDPTQLKLTIVEIDGKLTNIWVLYDENAALRRELPYTHVVYVTWDNSLDKNNISYVANLLRAFNVFRVIENTSVIWTILNSSFRLKMVVPVSGTEGKIAQTVNTTLGRYREEVVVDNVSGEVLIDGKPSLNLFRNYAVGSKDGQSVDISTLKFEGYDMSNQESLKYWYDKLREASNIPATRLQKDSSTTFNGNDLNIEREEIRFGYYINRIRSNWELIIVTALYNQMCLDFPDLKDDPMFESMIGVTFNKENVFEKLRQQDIISKNISYIQSLMSMQNADGTPYWDIDLLIEQFGGFDFELLKTNKERKEEAAKKGNPEEASAEGGAEPVMDMPDVEPTDVAAPTPEVADQPTDTIEPEL